MISKQLYMHPSLGTKKEREKELQLLDIVAQAQVGMHVLPSLGKRAFPQAFFIIQAISIMKHLDSEVVKEIAFFFG